MVRQDLPASEQLWLIALQALIARPVGVGADELVLEFSELGIRRSAGRASELRAGVGSLL